MNYNKTIILGRVTRDPELKKMPNGNSVTNFGVATNRTYTNKNGERVENVEFHNVVAFGTTAENSAKYLRKGQLVMVEGGLATRSWEKDDGSKAYKTEIIAHFVQFGPTASSFVEKAPEGEEVIDAETGEKSPATGKNEAKKGVKAGGSDSIDYPTEEINPDDIPF